MKAKSIYKEPIILLGANGFIGKAISKVLENNSVEHYPLGRDECDLLDFKGTKAYFEEFDKTPLRIIFLSSIKRTRDDSEISMEKNIEMAGNFVRATKNNKLVTCIFMSSIDVYDQRSGLPISEESDLYPDNFYAISKFCSELILNLSNQIDALTIFRLPGVYGTEDTDDSIISKFVNSISNNQEIVLTQDGSQLRDYLYADDIGEVVIKLLESPKSGVFNLSSGKSLSIASMVDIISRELNKKALIKRSDSDMTTNDITILNDKILEEIPEISFTSIENGIKRFINEN